MKATCLQENFIKGLNTVNRIVGKNITLPILNNILISAKTSRLTLTTTNLEIGVITKIGANVEKEGEITIPSRLLTEFVSLNTDKNINLSLDEQKLTLHSDHYNAHINGLAAADFPPVPENSQGKKIKVSFPPFLAAINSVVFSAAIDETRPVLTSVYCQFNKNELIMAATDSYRLSEKKIPVQSDYQGVILIPARSLLEVARSINPETAEIELIISENQIEFSSEQTKIVSKLLSGTFPEYQQIIPKDFKTVAEIKTKELISALKIAIAFSRENANNVSFNIFPDDKLEIVALSPQLGDNTATLKTKISGEKMSIAFNARFLVDALEIIKSEEIILKLINSSSPGLIQGLQQKDFSYVVMPLKLD